MELNGRHIFELTDQERHDRLMPVLLEELRRTAAMNLPIIYLNKDCTQKNHFIHEYPDGRKYLIEINCENSVETILKVLA